MENVNVKAKKLSTHVNLSRKRNIPSLNNAKTSRK